MKTRRVVRSEKAATEWGDWKPGPIPKREFPLSKQKGSVYSLGASWRWRVGRFSVGAEKYRVLIVFRPDLEKLSAWLGSEQDQDMTPLVRFEYHGHHPGWHVHTACGKEDLLHPGRMNQLNRRIPKRSAGHNRMTFGVTEQNAVDIVSKAFRLYRIPEGMFQ
jgi:hypothetical protein